MARDIASVADKDTREDGTPGEVPPLSDLPRSEGGPATREPEPRTEGGGASPDAEPDVAPDVPDLADPAVESAPAMAEDQDTSPDAFDANAAPAPPSLDNIRPFVADAEAAPDDVPAVADDLNAPAVASDDFDAAPGAVSLDEPSVVADAEPSEIETGDAAAWRSAIADALTEPEASPPDVAPTPEPPAEPSSFADVPAAEPGELSSPQPAAVPAPEDAGAAFTAAAADLFRPGDVREEPHLITLGRRLDPALRIPRPVAPDIVLPPSEPAAGGDAPWWKTVPWGHHLRTAARYAAYAVGGYLALVLVLIVLFRFVNPPGSSYMLGQFLTGRAIDRTWVPLESISRHLVRAVIVSEDGRFCEHSGIDTAAMKDAIERAARGTPRGASTISMQVTKNLFLWNARGYVRKVIEIPLTLFMEMIWPKRRILEVYLNIAEWAPGVFGAEAAAEHHFKKPASRLGAREAALLAAVLPNPVVRDASAPGPRTSAKARVVQSRVKAYGAVASCVVSHAAAAPPAATGPAATRPRQPVRKAPPRPAQPRKKAPADEWAPTLNFGPQ